MYGVIATSSDYKGIAREGAQAMLLQGELSACIQHPCYGAPHLANLQGVLELVEVVGLHSSQ